MYAYIKGILAAKKSDRIIVEAGGIGYNVFFPAGRIMMLPKNGSEICVYTYTSVREDAIKLYGFSSEDDLELFIQLTGVSGVGPKAAQALLSELTAAEIRMAILGEDIKTLCKAQGVAKKTAERIIVDLKGRVSVEDAVGLADISEIKEETTDAAVVEAVEALTALGYSAKEARAAAIKAKEEGAEGSEDVLKAALRYL
ncbi:MAG: Holliday junction branch migration protein RuvA [Lachnospiraceae bacterium]|nr:Holliday junction branch migration protein RuvA [Lachnospiraceae bacterium]